MFQFFIAENVWMQNCVIVIPQWGISAHCQHWSHILPVLNAYEDLLVLLQVTIRITEKVEL